MNWKVFYGQFIILMYDSGGLRLTVNANRGMSLVAASPGLRPDFGTADALEFTKIIEYLEEVIPDIKK